MDACFVRYYSKHGEDIQLNETDDALRLRNELIRIRCDVWPSVRFLLASGGGTTGVKPTVEMAVEKKASLAAEKFVLAVEKKAT